MSLQSLKALWKKLPCLQEPAAVQIVDFHVISSSSTDHRHSHGLWLQQGPQTSTWSPVASWIMDISMALCYSGFNETNLISSHACMSENMYCFFYLVQCPPSRLPQIPEFCSFSWLTIIPLCIYTTFSKSIQPWVTTVGDSCLLAEQCCNEYEWPGILFPWQMCLGAVYTAFLGKGHSGRLPGFGWITFSAVDLFSPCVFWTPVLSQMNKVHIFPLCKLSSHSSFSLLTRHFPVWNNSSIF